MQRDEMLEKIRNTDEQWDMIIIGGGATGLGTVLEAASRGYKVVLLEQSDFAKGTSSRSTKLVHGGVRYLRQGNISLVVEALRERGRLRRNAPHLVRDLSFIVPHYDWWEGPFYGVGLKLYDMLAGKMGLGPSKWISREKTLRKIPTVQTYGLRGGVMYYDAQFDDSRLATNLAQTAAEQGGVVVNYTKVVGLIKDEQDGLTRGVIVEDMEGGEHFEIRGKVVINATGVFTDGVRRMDDAESEKIIMPSQGVHIVLDKSFLPGNTAIMVPETDDGRVLFAIPWHDRVVVGTTDTEVEEPELEPRPLADEIDFLLIHASRYLQKEVTESDVLSMFAGLRPLVKPEGGGASASASRDHTLLISRSGLLTICGGKWTTYRKMAEECVDQAALVGDLEERASVTADLQIHGWMQVAEGSDPFKDGAVYGADWPHIEKLRKDEPALAELIHPELPYSCAEVVWSVRFEMARRLEDVLSRRTRALLLNARATLESASKVADLMAKELDWDENRKADEIKAFEAIAKRYILPENWKEDLDWSLKEL